MTMTPQEKAIFKFWNGTRHVWGDPLALSRRLDAVLGDPDAVFEAIRSEDMRERHAALECLIANVREVFAMPPIDPETGAGATEEDVQTALRALWKFLAKKKPSTDTPPSSSPSTGSPP